MGREKQSSKHKEQLACFSAFRDSSDMIPKEHQAYIDKVLSAVKAEPELIGLALSGSGIKENMDEFSDVDLMIVVDEQAYPAFLNRRTDFAQNLGDLLASFTGEHVGEPRLLICLYDNPLIHVDLKFVSLSDAGKRVEDYRILWDRDGSFQQAFEKETAQYPQPDLQWIEDRFWIWIHYAAGKIGRGELFETIEFISFLRQQVIGPLLLLSEGQKPNGVRKIESVAAEHLSLLKESVALYSRESCISAVRCLTELYCRLRASSGQEGLQCNPRAESTARNYFEAIARRFLDE